MKKNNILGAVFAALVLSIVPLVVAAKKYNIGLSSYSWFSGSVSSYDFFLYWKGQLLTLLCGLLALYVAVKGVVVKRDTLEDKGDTRIVVPAFVYFTMALVSTFLSDNRQMAIWGGYEQWEGMMIIGVYVILMLLTYHVIVGKPEIQIVLYALLAGAFILSFISARQAFGYDFFRTADGKKVMNLMLEDKLDFTFNFEVGRVYSTLYNPNYVGSYVALILPVILSLLSNIKNVLFTRHNVLLVKKVFCIVKNIVVLVTAAFLVIMLIGSESVTGFIGVFAAAVLFLVMMITNIKKKPLPFIVGGVLCIGAFASVILFNKSMFDYGINKILNPTANNNVVKCIESNDGVLYVKTQSDDILKLSVYIKDDKYGYNATDSAGKEAGIYCDEKSGFMKFSDERFAGIQIEEKKLTSDNKEYNGFIVNTPSVNKSYSFVMEKETWTSGPVQTIYEVYNPFSRIDALRHIETFGFENNQHFGSRRGYIWSRTIPLLKNYLFTGSGPNTFVCVFPNDDYIGMENVGYAGSIVTKPHNMYLQIFVQTGLISLIAFLVLYGVYFIDCLRLYFKKTNYTSLEMCGMGILLGTFGYLVTGLANDSTVAVAPLYWCLLGVGFAVNRYNKRAAVQSEEMEE